jgi:hypothetical protein
MQSAGRPSRLSQQQRHGGCGHLLRTGVCSYTLGASSACTLQRARQQVVQQSGLDMPCVCDMDVYLHVCAQGGRCSTRFVRHCLLDCPDKPFADYCCHRSM